LTEGEHEGDNGLIFVVVDGQNFRYNIPGWKRMKINYFNLGKVLFGRDFSREIVERMRVIYVDLFLIENSLAEFESVEEKNRFVDGLSNQGVRVQTCDFDALPRKPNGKRDLNMDRYIKSNLSVLAQDAKVSHIVLLSGDGDFLPDIQAAVKNGKVVTVISTKNSLSPKILREDNIKVLFFEDVVNELRR
jgi:uncharacterized LabA/DUF88 family protein